MKFGETELPDTNDILTHLRSISTADKNQVKKIEVFLFDTTQKMEVALSKYVDEKEYEEDPDTVNTVLKRFHFYNGGLLGLAEALYRKVKSDSYIGLTEEVLDPDTKSKKGKLTMGDREQYSKGQAANLEGLVRLLNERQSNLHHRLFGYRMH